MIGANRARKTIKSVRKSLSRTKAWLRLLPLLFRVRRDPALRPILRSYLSGVPLCVFSEPLTWLRLACTTRRRFRKSEQRPKQFYAPCLDATPFGAPDSVSSFLESNLAEIQAEFQKVARLEISTPSRALVDEGTWNTFPLRRSTIDLDENISRCPETWSIVQQCPLLSGVSGGVYFSIMYPSTHVRPHCGPSNLKRRYHLTLEEADGARIRSGDQWRTWQEGECLILDDSFEHEVQHRGDRKRVVLIIDCWHPDLNEHERDFLARLHLVWRRDELA